MGGVIKPAWSRCDVVEHYLNSGFERQVEEIIALWGQAGLYETFAPTKG